MPPKSKKSAAAGGAGTFPVPPANAALPFVSVLTPTYNRRKFIPLAIQMFKAQTYPQDRMEWVILDDGTDKVGDLFAASGLKNVRYHALDTKLPIGAKRNRVNELARGDICVAWDDDDYYPPDRVKNAVRKLRSVPNRRVPVTGASQMYLYYTDRDEIWNIGPYNPNHCTNGTMAYWRSYFKDHRYDDTAEKAEERVFMDEWRTSVIQQTPEETMLVICHTKNTFDKRVLLEKTNPTMKKLSIKLRNFVKDKKIAEFYLGLKADFAEESKPTAPTVSEADLNPALEFPTGVPTPAVSEADLRQEGAPTPVVSEADLRQEGAPTPVVSEADLRQEGAPTPAVSEADLRQEGAPMPVSVVDTPTLVVAEVESTPEAPVTEGVPLLSHDRPVPESLPQPAE